MLKQLTEVGKVIGCQHTTYHEQLEEPSLTVLYI